MSHLHWQRGLGFTHPLLNLRCAVRRQRSLSLSLSLGREGPTGRRVARGGRRALCVCVCGGRGMGGG
jgi:hypothetical protein